MAIALVPMPDAEKVRPKLIFQTSSLLFLYKFGVLGCSVYNDCLTLTSEGLTKTTQNLMKFYRPFCFLGQVFVLLGQLKASPVEKPP